MGLFETGFDPNAWGWPEWVVLAFGGYALISVLFTTRRAVDSVKRLPTNLRKGARRARRRVGRRIAGEEE